MKRPKFKPPEPSSVGFREKLWVGLGAGLAIFCTGLIGGQLIGSSGTPCLLASMGASAVILFAVPHSPMASHWAVAGGHFWSVAVGVTCARLIPDIWVAAALAVGISIFAMHLLRCLHPPGGASALAMVLGGDSVRELGYQFLLTPLALNLAVLLLLAGIFNLRPGARRSTVVRPGEASADPPPLERMGIRPEDLRAALRDLHAFVDVSEGELSEIYNLAASRAYRRKFGEWKCADIMSRDLAMVEFGTGLEETWTLMRTRGIKALPVVDRGRHVIGIVTMADFFRHARVEQFDGLGGRLSRLIRPTPGLTSNKAEVAGQIMSEPVVTARENSPIADLVPLLSERGIHQIPIVDPRGKLAGLVTQSDLIAALYRDSEPGGSRLGGEPRGNSPGG